jgi:hypothetical protein
MDDLCAAVKYRKDNDLGAWIVIDSNGSIR